MSAPQNKAETTETVTWEIHALTPDGSEGPITFAGRPAAAYDDIHRAGYWTDRYTSEQVGWKVPVEERKRFFLVEITSTTTTYTGTPASQAEDGVGFENQQVTVVRRRVREGVSWYAEDGTVREDSVAGEQV